jgi:GntR family transcriptional repressor for pyruvate dehydrogenase complex
MESRKHHIKQFIEEDANFHLALAEATRNRVFRSLIDSFYELTEGSIFALTRLTPYSVVDAQKHHYGLIRAIETRNENLAVATIHHHIDLLRSEMELLKKQHLL